MNNVCIITGAAKGIGLSLAKKMLKQGHSVIGVDLDTTGLKELEKWAQGQHCIFTAKVLDVTDTNAIESLISEVENSKKRISHWINSAGISGLGDFSKQSEEEFEKVLEINLLSVVRITRRAIKHMEQNGFGHIVTLGSVSGFVPAPQMSAYSTSKHALVGFHRSLKLDLKMKGSPVKTLLVSPGFVKTELIQLGSKKGFPQWLSPVLAEADDVANTILRAIEKDADEILPTLNGKVIKALHSLSPKLVQKSSKLLLARNWKDLLLNNLSTDL